MHFTSDGCERSLFKAFYYRLLKSSDITGVLHMADEKEFIFFLVGGLAIIAVLMIIGVGFQYGSQVTGSITGLGSPIFVGTAAIEKVDTLYASFDANNFLSTNVYDMGTREIKSGLLFGATSVTLGVGKADSVDVSFDVVSTNGYGPLIVRIDDKVVEESKLDLGHYEFSFGSGKKIEIAAGNSEWRIWAPALYRLDNLKITANGYPRDISTYTFKLSEPGNIDSARIDFNLRSNAGSLLLKLNGDVVYDGAVNPSQSIYIDQSKLDKLNIITFDAHEDSRFSGRATIALTHKTQEEKVFRADINLTQAEYNKFSTGTIGFDVVDVFAGGGYSIKIVNSNAILLNEYVKLEKGYFEFPIKKANMKPGLNTIIITSLDGSAFNVQSLTARL